MSHTPGPWAWIKREKDDPSEVDCWDLCGPDGKPLKPLCRAWFGWEDDANARLMKSGPELKEQRDELLDACKCLLEPSYSRRTAEHKARAAIAKAEGRNGP